MLPALHSEWKERHETVTVEASASLPDVLERTTVCRQAGFCVCSAAGKRTQKLRNAMLREMKATFPTNPARVPLRAGMIVICWTRSSACCDECENKPLECWWHVGAMSLKPYRPTMMGLQRVTHPDERICGTELQRAVVEARTPTHIHHLSPNTTWSPASRLSPSSGFKHKYARRLNTWSGCSFLPLNGCV